MSVSKLGREHECLRYAAEDSWAIRYRELCLRRDLRGESFEIASVGVANHDSRTVENLREQPVATTVKVVSSGDLVSGGKQAGNGADRGEVRWRSRKARSAFSKLRNLLFEDRTRGLPLRE
jgi:hypothetical protein